MARSRPAPPPRDRVTWAQGKAGEHQKHEWARQAAAYCNAKHRPKAAVAVRAIADFINLNFGYGWPTDEDLRLALGAKHASAPKRAVEQLEHELGIIDRVTFVIKDDGGHVCGRRRRIFACLPLDFHSVLAAISRPKAESTSPKAECDENSVEKTGTYSTFGLRSGAISPKAESEVETAAKTIVSTKSDTSTEGRKLPKAESCIPEVRESRPIKITNSVIIGKDSYGPPKTSKSILPNPASPEALRLVDDLARIGPDEEDSYEIIRIGRVAWRLFKQDEITANDAAALRDHLEDAARRAWLDHRPEIQKMLAAAWPAHDDGRLPWEIEAR